MKPSWSVGLDPLNEHPCALQKPSIDTLVLCMRVSMEDFCADLNPIDPLISWCTLYYVDPSYYSSAKILVDRFSPTYPLSFSFHPSTSLSPRSSSCVGQLYNSHTH